MSVDDTYPEYHAEDYYLYHDKSLHSALVIEKRLELEETEECITLESEWEQIFHASHYLLKLKERALAGDLKAFSFRSLTWQLFLGVLPGDIGSFLDAANANRDRYDILKSNYVVDPHVLETSMSLSVNNPLSQEEDSPWAQFFQDTELRQEIMQDISRTYPGEIMFEQPEIRNMMLNILFIYSRENTDVSYKQGMHELLAPLVYVFYTEYKLTTDIASTTSELMRSIMDFTYLEHDLYWTYARLMEHTMPYYRTDPVKKEAAPPIQLFTAHQTKPSSYVVQKLHDLQNRVLRSFDAELYQHLKKLGVEPQLYGLRWFRLLFGREFNLQELLILWDAIFASPDFSGMVDYIGISMLLYIRHGLLFCDYAGCISLLMRFPGISDVHYFVKRALFLRNPSRYEAPPNWQYRLNTNGRQPPSNNSTTVTTTVHNREQNRQQPRTSSFSKTASNSVATLSELGDSIKKKLIQAKVSPTTTYTSPNTQTQLRSRSTHKEQARIIQHCTTRLDVLISELQTTITDLCAEQETQYEDRFVLSLADLKQVRDILKGNVSLGSIIGESETPSIVSTDTDTQSISLEKQQDVLKADVNETGNNPFQANTIQPEQSLPPTDLETLNLFADLEPVLPKKTSSGSPKGGVNKTTNKDFLDPLSSLLIDQDKNDDLPEFLRK